MIVSSAWIITVLLVATRLGSLFLLTPITPVRQLPMPVRLFLLLGLSAVMTEGLHLSFPHENDIAVIMAGLAEVINGLILSLSIFAVFAALSLAGLLIDSQMGLNGTTVLNPQAHSQEPLTGHFLNMLAVLLLFACGGHRLLLKGLAFSLIALPPGTLLASTGLAPALQQFAQLFITGLMIAAPVVFCLLLLDMATGIVTRSMPQISVYFITLPVKILLGLLLLMMSLSTLGPLLETLFQQIFNQWQITLS